MSGPPAGLHFHDLRHTGNLLAARTGVSTKDLMARMGHDDMRAALIYQRATSESDRRIAEQLGALVERHNGDEDGHRRRWRRGRLSRGSGAGELVAR
jgi:hypothetical protein